MVWPLTWVVIAGTLPGVIAGGFIRLEVAARPRALQGLRGLRAALHRGAPVLGPCSSSAGRPASAEQRARAPCWRVSPAAFTVEACTLSWRRLCFTFAGQDYACSTPGIFGLSLAVGMVGGVYGIGGGAIVAPFFVAVFGLPVHAVAGAALMGTFVTSVVGVAFYQAIAPWYAGQLAVAPDWLLGAALRPGRGGGHVLRGAPAKALRQAGVASS